MHGKSCRHRPEKEQRTLSMRHMVNQRGLTLIELVSVMLIMGVLASVTIKRFNLISSNAETRALDAARAELNIRETLTWTQIKLSNTGWIDDENVFGNMDTILGTEYSWDSGPTLTGGTLFFRDISVKLIRNSSTPLSAGSWQ